MLFRSRYLTTVGLGGSDGERHGKEKDKSDELSTWAKFNFEPFDP